MKKTIVFIFLCCLLLSCFSTKIQAQIDSDNSITQQYKDDRFEFVYKIDPVYSNNEELIGAQITVINSNISAIDQNIIFRARIANQASQTPNIYETEEVLKLVNIPLRPGEQRLLYIGFAEKTRNEIIIIWPIVDGSRSFR